MSASQLYCVKNIIQKNFKTKLLNKSFKKLEFKILDFINAVNYKTFLVKMSPTESCLISKNKFC